MSMENELYVKFDHDNFARSKEPTDFWGQIRRTVNGKPVSDDQIEMIVSKITSELSLKSEDKLLDLACGNGALSKYIFDKCEASLGVDLSEFLISIAKKNFETPCNKFIIDDIVNYVRHEQFPDKFSKAFCYGSFSYLSNDAAHELLSVLYVRFKNVNRVFLGNLPDKKFIEKFYSKKMPCVDEINDHRSQIGIWRTEAEFTDLFGSIGWDIEISRMPPDFYSSYYRYDVLLKRNGIR